MTTATTSAGGDPPLSLLIDAGGDIASTPIEFESVAQSAEDDGYDGVLITETRHDPFIGLALAARGTRRIQLASGIAVAFARNPMTMAMLANDVQLVSKGRFTLGLGSQIKPHIERRFSMPWSSPARRMSDYIAAMRAIWASWATGEKLAYRGEFYQHTLMTPFFDPGPNPYGPAPVWLAAVGELMTEAAGEVADGVICHSLTTRRYLDEVTLPALRRGALRAGRDAELGLSVPAFVVLGNDQAQLDAATLATRKQIAFYGSTPAYRGVLELHGWGDVADRLHAGSRRGEWDQMATLIDDEMLDAFAVIGGPKQVAAQLHERYDGLATRISFNAPYEVDPDAWRDVLGALRAS
ncbi:MAG: family F420-dependent class oxidoreductase [Thermoleophilia bacterium]|nr:family F420-dependent class oxidoreductase [Thermoleophilia bacterium]